MSDVDGAWNCTVDTPMGEQQFVLTVASAGTTFAGRAEGSLGTLEIPEGEVDGTTLKWPMKVTKPMSITLNCTADVAGEEITGKMSAGIFGSFKLHGTRA